MGRILIFFGNMWFVLEKGDGKIDRFLILIFFEEEKFFKYLLNL